MVQEIYKARIFFAGAFYEINCEAGREVKSSIRALSAYSVPPNYTVHLITKKSLPHELRSYLLANILPTSCNPSYVLLHDSKGNLEVFRGKKKLLLFKQTYTFKVTL